MSLKRLIPLLVLPIIGCGASSPLETNARSIGISIYPGAVEVKAPEKALATTAPDEKNVRIYLESADSAKKVADYYAKETGIKAVSEGEGFSLMGKTPKGVFLIMGVEPKSGSGSKVTAMALVAK